MVQECHTGYYPTTYMYMYMYMYTGSIVLLAIVLLSPLFNYIPKTTLSAIIIAAVLPMVDVRIFYKIFKIRGLLGHM